MGKDQDLLEAARCGNISVVERILNQRAKKSGPLASLRRGPGPNVQDSSGYTPLHHAALNGHKDIVSLLLKHDAMPNIVDDKGCTPVHLAAWSGNTEIVKLLLTQAPPVPIVNHMNFDHESALHSAAQYGHTEIVKLLLQHNCYPSVRNVRNESPLDLASQYGRLETVQCLLNFHPGLLTDIVRSHSPLHLASKNGHKHVVKALLDAGFDINYLTDVGTALHEAAMYGKVEVVKLLLDYGVDVNLTNSRKRTVLDVLQDLNTAIARQIEDEIKDHMTLIKLDTDSTESLPTILPPHGFISGSRLDSLIPEKCSISDISPPRQFCSPSPEDSFYEIPPLPKLINHSTSGGNDSLSSLTQSQSQDSSFDQTSCSSYSPTKCDTTESSIYENSVLHSIETDNLLYEIPPPPSFFSNKRFSDPLQQNIYQNVIIKNSTESNDKSFDSCTLPTSWTLPDAYIPMLPLHSEPFNNRPQPPAKPPRKSVSPSTNDLKKEHHSSKSKNSYEFLCLATSGQQHHHQSSNYWDNGQKDDLKALSYPNSHYASEYVDMSSQNTTSGHYENHEIICSSGLCNKKQPSVTSNPKRISSRFAEILPYTLLPEDPVRKPSNLSNLMPSKSTPALHASRHTLDHVIPLTNAEKSFHVLKPNCLNLRQKRTTKIPTSPTNYEQPPTPDIPPPSPATAETGIHEKIRPINQEYKTKKLVSRDIDTLTDEQLVATIGPSGEVQLILATDNKCVSTENSETSVNPFAGLCHGSVSHSEKSKQFRHPGTIQKINQPPISSFKNNIYENVIITMEPNKHKAHIDNSDNNTSGSNHNSLSVMSPFDEKAEWAEIADIMASFGGGITRESLFAQEIESHFAQSFKEDSTKCVNSSNFATVEEWLSHLGLSQYENLFLINGFDDICFLGGKILEEQDLEEIGIKNPDHRQKILLAAQHLPAIQPVSKLKSTPDFPSSVDNWLSSINLTEYGDNFLNNNITNMDRALKLWEVELNTVLKITKLGHRKRILASLGDKHFENFFNTDEVDISKLNVDLSELDIDDSHETKYCVINAATPCSQDAFEFSESDENFLRIRPPTQLMSDSTSINKSSQQIEWEAQWRHHPDELISSSCNYMAKYLGSTLVKELKGLDSTKKSIQKLKMSSKDIGKIPNIILSISYSGVKFINAETQQLVCEHEIRNIHCACQDADDLRHFAYITKEHQTHNHYCHVFSSESMELASEIILTLGQAFEVAYQMAVREKAAKVKRMSEPSSAASGHASTKSAELGKKKTRS